MKHYEFDLAVGDVLEFGEYVLTVVDIVDDEVSFRVDPREEVTSPELDCDPMMVGLPPR